VRAERLCPDAVFVPPDFVRYRAASKLVREIMLRHTPLVEPLSLDEAYLDVTQNLTGHSSATAVAKSIRAEIFAETGLTASAGVAPAKFLAKIASDWRKPNGLFVIRPEHVLDFLTPLPVGRLHGVGKVMEAKLKALGLNTLGELRATPEAMLEAHFGRWGRRLHELSQGIDHSEVHVERPTQSVSAEDTFEQDQPLQALEPTIRRLAERTWAGGVESGRIARTVVLKLKTADFHTITRSLTPPTPPSSARAIADMACELRQRVDSSDGRLFRLVGVGLSNFVDAVQFAPQAEMFPDRPG
jgi:DNA polymerase-4